MVIVCLGFADVVNSYSVDIDVAGALSGQRRCPGCAKPTLGVVTNREHPYLHCPPCDQSWHVESGWAWPLSRPETVDTIPSSAPQNSL
jgi:hypothetical protein